MSACQSAHKSVRTSSYVLMCSFADAYMTLTTPHCAKNICVTLTAHTPFMALQTNTILRPSTIANAWLDTLCKKSATGQTQTTSVSKMTLAAPTPVVRMRSAARWKLENGGTVHLSNLRSTGTYIHCSCMLLIIVFLFIRVVANGYFV